MVTQLNVGKNNCHFRIEANLLYHVVKAAVCPIKQVKSGNEEKKSLYSRTYSRIIRDAYQLNESSVAGFTKGIKLIL